MRRFTLDHCRLRLAVKRGRRRRWSAANRRLRLAVSEGCRREFIGSCEGLPWTTVACGLPLNEEEGDGGPPLTVAFGLRLVKAAVASLLVYAKVYLGPPSPAACR